MSRKLSVVMALAVLGVSASRTASAQSVFFDNYCVSSFNVCASVRVFASGNNLTMQIWNLNGTLGVRHTITSVGLYHLGSANEWNGTIRDFSATWVRGNGSEVNVTRYWRPTWGNDIRTLAAERIELAEGVSGTAGGIVGCNDPGGQLHFSTCTQGESSFPSNPMLVFNFRLSRPFSLADNTNLRWHSQQLPGGRSAKCDTGVGQNIDYGPCEPPGTVTPEPITIALLGTGLAGLGGAGLARRRRRKQDVV